MTIMTIMMLTVMIEVFRLVVTRDTDGTEFVDGGGGADDGQMMR